MSITTVGQSDPCQLLGQRLGAARKPCGEPGDLLDERHHRAVGLSATEPADTNVESNAAAADGKISEPAPIPAMRARRHGAATRTHCRRFRRTHRENDNIAIKIDRFQPSRGQMREQHVNPLMSAQAADLPATVGHLAERHTNPTSHTCNKISDRAKMSV
jgi:hypothetical protein